MSEEQKQLQKRKVVEQQSNKAVGHIINIHLTYLVRSEIS